MLQTIDDKALNIQVTRNKKNQEVSSGIAKAGGGGVGRSFENLSSGTKAKRSFKADFLTSGVKETFIHLQKAFTKALILRYFDPECHI